jgi:predicted ATP-grasp superfamily ATP-dependent carboligase
MTQILLLDGQQRSALAVARSLGRRGIDVHVADARTPCLAGVSRYARSTLRSPDPEHDPHRFVSWVYQTASNRGFDSVFPVTDTSTMLLLSHADRPPGIKLICAPAKCYALLTDKASLLDLAGRVGVRIPETSVAKGAEQIEACVLRARFPLVLKPARSRVLLGGQIIKTSVFVAESAHEALRFARAQTWIEASPCLLQEYIAGHGAGVFSLYAAGRPIAWFAHRRIREKPPRGGVSVLSESIPVDPALRTSATRILDAVGYQGAAMVEFRIDPNGVAYLMEINARLWGSLQLAVDCGVDFPWLMCQASNGQRLDTVERYLIGQRLRWFLGDLDNLLIELRGHGLSQNKGERFRRVWQAFQSCVDFGARNEVFRWSDPAPGLLELRQWVRDLA